MAHYCVKCAKGFDGSEHICSECGAATRDEEELPGLNLVAQGQIDKETGDIKHKRLFEVIEGQKENLISG